MNSVKNEDAAKYEANSNTVINGSPYTKSELEIIEKAKKILEKKIKKHTYLTSPEIASDLLITRYSNYEHEIFGLILLNNKHGVIDVKELFRGTIDAASVYPREVVKTVLESNAAAVIMFHNHPSGTNNPSGSDDAITRKIKGVLDVVDVRVLDHLIVAGGDTYSYAEHGKI